MRTDTAGRTPRVGTPRPFGPTPGGSVDGLDESFDAAPALDVPRTVGVRLTEPRTCRSAASRSAGFPHSRGALGVGGCVIEQHLPNTNGAASAPIPPSPTPESSTSARPTASRSRCSGTRAATSSASSCQTRGSARSSSSSSTSATTQWTCCLHPLRVRGTPRARVQRRLRRERARRGLTCAAPPA